MRIRSKASHDAPARLQYSIKSERKCAHFTAAAFTNPGTLKIFFFFLRKRKEKNARVPYIFTSLITRIRKIALLDNVLTFFSRQIISGQQLPRPRGSAAKATIVDPYVLIQIYGIAIDCAGMMMALRLYG